MKKLLSLGILCAAVIAAPLVAHADPLTFNGSDSVGATNVVSNGSESLKNATSFTFGGLFFYGNGTSGLPIAQGFGDGGTIYVDPSGLGGVGGSAYTITFGDYGTFTETAAPQVIGTATDEFIQLYLIGTFSPTPGGPFDGYAPDESASLRLSFNRSGTPGNYSIGAGGSFASPPEALPSSVPEPSSLILLGTGLIGGVGAMRRRFKA